MTGILDFSHFFIYLYVYKFYVIMIISKLVVFLLVMAILNIVRESFYIVKCFRVLKEYKIGAWRTFLVWASISYIITVLIFGI